MDYSFGLFSNGETAHNFLGYNRSYYLSLSLFLIWTILIVANF